MYLLQVLLGDEGIKRDLNIVLVVERLSSVGIKPQATDGTSVLSLEFISPAQRKQFIFTSLPPALSLFFFLPLSLLPTLQEQHRFQLGLMDDAAECFVSQVNV